MESRLTLLSIYIAFYLPALSVQSGLADNWASIQRVEPSEAKSLKTRFWNDDLEPCIMKYCLRHQMETRLYMKCIRRHCPSGLVTVPRDTEENKIPQLLPVLEEGRTEWLDGGLVSDNVNKVCAKLFCGYMRESSVRDECARTTCSTSAFTLSAMPAGDNFNDNAIDGGGPSATFWKWLAERAHMDQETNNDVVGTQTGSSVRRTSGGPSDMCSLVMCAGRHGADFLACAEERCVSSRSQRLSRVHAAGTLPSGERANRSASNDDDGEEEDGSDDRAASLSIRNVQRRSEADSSERTLKRKRRINDEVSQCIQSYCGSHGSRTQRLACIVRSCHRTG